VLGAGIVENEAGLEIVQSVEDDIDVGDVVLDVGRIHIVNNGFDLNSGVDSPEFRRSCFCFGKIQSNIFFVVERLALQIRRLDKIPIDDAQVGHARAREKF